MLKKLKARVIYIELDPVDGPEVPILPTVKKWRRRFHQRRMYLFDDARSGRPIANDLAGAIGSMLEERPFSSGKRLYRHIRIGKVICMGIIHNRVALKRFHLC
jgi:hypothetical protein